MYYVVDFRQTREDQVIIAAECYEDAVRLAHLQVDFPVITDQQYVCKELREE